VPAAPRGCVVLLPACAAAVALTAGRPPAASATRAADVAQQKARRRIDPGVSPRVIAFPPPTLSAPLTHNCAVTLSEERHADSHLRNAASPSQNAAHALGHVTHGWGCLVSGMKR
jgi:hypothetical protein